MKKSKITSMEVEEMAASVSLTDDLFEPVGLEESQAEHMFTKSVSYWQDAFRRLRKNKVAVASVIFIVILTLFAIFAPILSKYDYAKVDIPSKNLRPSAEHWFGTDELGRDLWVRVWIGARVSLLIALIAAVIQSTVGVIIGGISGYLGGKVDLLIMRIADIIDAIPLLVYVILITMVMGSGIAPIIVAFALTGWIRMARLVRGQVFSLKTNEYVMAAKGLGASNWRILISHMLPNMVGVIIVTLTMNIPTAIFTEAYLSYIGIGIQAPLTSWGLLANAGSKVMEIHPYQLIIPAIFISLTMLAMQLFGDGLRDALDPKLRK